jgi:hypothetical protein
MSEAERKQDKVWGAEQLLNLDLNNTTVRKLALDFLFQENNYLRIMEIFNQPTNPNEAILLMGSAEQVGDLDIINKTIENKFIKNSPDSAVKEKRQSLSTFLRSKNYGTN